MTSRHPAVSCACPKCQSERRTTPPPATEEREALGATVSAFWDTKDTVESCINAVLSALAPYRAAEILAAEARGRDAKLPSEVMFITPTQYVADLTTAEANERARISEWLRATSTGLDLTKRRIADAIERNEHGAGK